MTVKSPTETPEQETRPFLTGSGPAEASSDRRLAVRPQWSHDVNGYYRELGVPWNATRAELRRAYQRVNGQNSVRLTYVFKQLLDPQVRMDYDLTPLGQRYFDDYEWEIHRKKMREQARQAREQATGRVATIEEVEGLMNSVLEDIVAEDRLLKQVLDQDRWLSKDDTYFPWSYYVYGTHRDDTTEERRTLRIWQKLLLSSFGEFGVRTNFALGVSQHGTMVRKVGYRWVFFIDGIPSRKAARGLIFDWIRLQSNTPRRIA